LDEAKTDDNITVGQYICQCHCQFQTNRTKRSDRHVKTKEWNTEDGKTKFASKNFCRTIKEEN